VNEWLNHFDRLNDIAAYSGKLRYELGVSVKALRETRSRTAVQATFEAAHAVELPESYDLVLLCTGFGLERADFDIPHLSYWENDNLNRPALLPVRQFRRLISGAGDGGLTDALRAALKGRSHRVIINEISGASTRLLVERQCQYEDAPDFNFAQPPFRSPKDSTPGTLRRQLLLEEALARIEEDALAKTAANADPRDVQHFLYGEYLKVQRRFPENFSRLSELVQYSKRGDVDVILSADGENAMYMSAQPINRFGVFILDRAQLIRFLPGRIAFAKAAKRVVKATMRRGMETKPPRVFEDVICRYGPVSPLIDLFGEALADEATDYRPEVSEALAQSHYNEPFVSKLRSVLAVPPSSHLKALQHDYVKLLRHVEADLRAEGIAIADAKPMRLTIWRPLTKRFDSPLIRLTPYIPGNIGTQYIASPHWLTRSKGLIGIAMKNGLPTSSPSSLDWDHRRNVDYQVHLFEKMGFSTLDIDLVSLNFKYGLAIPFVDEDGRVHAVLWADFKSHRDCMKARTLLTRKSALFEQAAIIESQVSGELRFRELQEQYAWHCPSELYQLADIFGPPGSYLEVGRSALPVDSAELSSSVFCRNPWTQHDTYPDYVVAVLEKAGSYFAVLDYRSNHRLGDKVLIGGRVRGKIVRINKPIGSIPLSSVKDGTGYLNHCLNAFARLDIRPNFIDVAMMTPLLHDEEVIVALANNGMANGNFGYSQGIVTRPRMTLLAQYLGEDYWFHDVTEVRLSSETPAIEMFGGGVVFSRATRCAMGSIVWRAGDKVYVYPVNRIAERLGMLVSWITKLQE
jgi:hypothetical protein